MSNGEQRWGGEGEITLPPICAKSTVNLQEKEKKMFVINTDASLNFTSRGGVYIAGEGEAGEVSQHVWVLPWFLYVLVFEGKHVRF